MCIRDSLKACLEGRSHLLHAAFQSLLNYIGIADVRGELIAVHQGISPLDQFHVHTAAVQRILHRLHLRLDAADILIHAARAGTTARGKRQAHDKTAYCNQKFLQNDLSSKIFYPHRKRRHDQKGKKHKRPRAGPWDVLERETGFEPATFGLGSRRSTAELLPHCLI